MRDNYGVYGPFPARELRQLGTARLWYDGQITQNLTERDQSNLGGGGH